MTNMPIPNQTSEVQEDDVLFSSYEEQENFIQSIEDRHSLTRRIEEDAKLYELADLRIIDEFDFVLPDASSFSLFANWQLHPNGKHVYGYRLCGLGGFSVTEKTPAGNGVYLSMEPLIGDEGQQTSGRHAFSPPMHPFVVINEPVYLQTNPELLFQPIHPDDTLWLKLNKAAALRTLSFKKWKWDELAIGDMLTDMLWKAGYDSIYFNSSGPPWVVLLMPGRPAASKKSTQSSISKSQPIQTLIQGSFECRKIQGFRPPGGPTLNDDDCGIYGWPNDYTEIESATLQFYFAQDWVDGESIAFAKVDLGTFAQTEASLSGLVQDVVEIEATGFHAQKVVSSDLTLLPDIELNSDGLRIGARSIEWWEFENAVWDETQRFEWFWNGKPLPFDPAFLYEPPRGMSFGEWHKVILESDYIRRHTSHPWVSSRSVVDAMDSFDHADFVEWLLMLPDAHLQNIGLLQESLEWIENERLLKKIRPLEHSVLP